MKVYYIGNNAEGCYQVRCMLPQVHNNWKGSMNNLVELPKDNEQMFLEAMKSDVIVFQRPIEEEKLKSVKLLKEAGKIVVFDNDDTYKADSGIPMVLKGKRNTEYLNKCNRVLNGFIKEADLVTTTTEFLAKEYRQYNKNVVVLPNCIDPFNWNEPKRNKGDKVRIGFVGSVTFNDEYKHIQGTLDYLKKRDDVEIIVYGLPPDKDPKYKLQRKLYRSQLNFWRKYADERVPQSRMYQYFDNINDIELDLVIIPRKDNYFNRCKSNIKFLEMSMLEIPVVAQSFPDGLSPYDKDINGSNGLLAKDDEDFKEKVTLLIENKELRRKMGKEAKKYVLKNYNIENKAHLWADTYLKTYKKLYEKRNNQK